MKKKEPRGKTKFIWDVIVYRENLEEMIQLFESKGMQITISDSEFEYSELDEVTKQRGYHPRELNISGNVPGDNYGGSVYVSFYKDHASVEVSAYSSEAYYNLWYELVDCLEKNRSWRKKISTPFIWCFVAFIAFALEIVISLKESQGSKIPWWVHVTLIILMVSGPLSYTYSRSLTTVKLARRYNSGFWSRNRESVILLVMGAVLGGIVTYIVTLLAK